MAEQTLTFNSSAHFTKIYSTTELKDDSATKQGYYNGYPSPAVGVMRFAGLADINWKTKSIKSIEATLHNGTSGRYGVTKTFGLYGSNLQKDSDETTYGYEWIDGQEVLGEFDLYCARDTDLTLSLPNDNASLLANIEAYLKSGSVDTFCLYMNESEKDGGANYSANYLAVTDASLTITFDDALSLVNYCKDGEWVPCMPYYGKDGKWVPCTPYYGKDGKWVQMGASSRITHPTVAMSANESGGYLATASTTYSTNYEPWRAFDKSLSGNVWVSAKDDADAWIWLKLPRPITVTKISIANRIRTDGLVNGVIDARIDASNDKTTWSEIGMITGRDGTASGLVTEHSIPRSAVPYQYIRIKPLSWQNMDNTESYVSIAEIEITGVE